MRAARFPAVSSPMQKSYSSQDQNAPGLLQGERAVREMKCAPGSGLQIVMPVAIAVIYILWFLTYRSFLEAARVAGRPFALTGGLYLCGAWVNFSVAVWSASSHSRHRRAGTTSYGDFLRAVARKKKEHGTPYISTLREAVLEGALLRLRPS